MRILIVDDDFICRRVMQKQLSSYAICDMAANGREAINAFSLALEKEDPYRFIFLDIMLPDIDGIEVLKNIRQMEKEKGVREHKRAKIIMTTAQKDSTSVLEAINFECDDYVVKPIVGYRFINKLRKLGFFQIGLFR